MKNAVKQTSFALGVIALFLLPLGIWYRNQLTTDEQTLPAIGPASLSEEQIQACLDYENLDWGMLESYWAPGILYDDLQRQFFGRILCAMGELPLTRVFGQSDLSMRVLVARSFHQTYMIRIQHYSDNTQLVAKKLTFPTGPARVSEQRELALSGQQWAAIKTELDAMGFWELESPDPSGPGIDGSDWIFEVAMAGRYHVVHRRNAAGLEAIGELLLDRSYLVVGPRY